jgi:uncharacterized protein (TIGR02246 family)
VNVREDDVETLYLTFLDHWNRRDAVGMAALCVPHAYVIGFDGSELDGRDAIEAELRRIFAHHTTPSYVAKVRSVQLFDDVAVLRAIVGMVPPGADDLNPDLNAIQTFVASRDTGRWKVEVLQNTPAAFHGRPEARERLTAELREVFRIRGR